ncbi:MAG: hypothetical protein OK438_05845 [Thaumarchaeota archaeon]|nr:hypothetical protein [Nitrososphaerota archaeon]
MSDDDAVYRRSVRNTLLVLAVVLMALVAAFIASPYLTPNQERLQTSGSAASPYGFSLNLNMNATRLSSAERLNITIWLDSTSSQIQNVTALDSWAVSRSALWVNPCLSANLWWPIGMGVMKGFETESNFSSGEFVLGPQEFLGCLPITNSTNGTIEGPAHYFVLEPHSSKAIVDLNNNFEFWPIRTTFLIGSDSLAPGQHLAGFYTAIGADEWGDLVILHFRVP